MTIDKYQRSRLDFDLSAKVSHIGMPSVYTVKPVLSGHTKKDLKLVFRTDYRLMQVKSIAE